jgi:hypothetical protein
MGQLTGDFALMAADVRELRLAAAEGRRHDRPIACPSQCITQNFKQSAQSRTPIRSSASARPHIP